MSNIDSNMNGTNTYLNYNVGRIEKAKISSIFTRVYGWMAVGLVVSAISAIYTYGVLNHMSKSIFYGCMIGEVALVLILSTMVNKLSSIVATIMFLVYSILNGVTLSIIFVIYELPSIQNIFLLTAGMFGGMALIGATTKKDLSGVGAFCMMGLWGVIIASLVNIFVKSIQIDFVCSIVGIIIFIGLTAWDAQKIKQLASMEKELDKEMISKLGIIGALTLYLDFINLFLRLLSLFGKKK